MQEEYRELIQDFIKILKGYFKESLVSVILFGSVARGTAKKDSDIDICIVVKKLPQSRYQRHKLISPLLGKLREGRTYDLLFKKGYLPEIATVLYTKEEIKETRPIFLDMVEEAVVLLDDGSFKVKIDELKARLKQLGSQKTYLEDGSYFWRLKPEAKFGEVISL
ncbi:nucleotidyltransferase domain-containing protein [Thermodesulfovibrionales bacterium]|nr:nucleotidyltransferase domain-containing protein [Thermodesulfovibrionales bacterium]